MIIVKCTIFLWILFIIFRFFVRSTISNEDRLLAAWTGRLRMTFGRWLMVLTFMLAIIGTIASAIWLFFIR